ncbi:MAG: cytochrome c peroxidase [Gammaproteobacteria bacterium]
MKKLLLTGLVLFIVTESVQAVDANRLLRKASRYFEPLPATMPGAENDTPERIALGKALFFDPRLSVNDAQSCETCHRLGKGQAGIDNRPTAVGAKGDLGTRNTPTVLNAGWQFAQFWDGRAKDLADQAKQPILNPIEMAMPSPEAVVEKLKKIPEYREGFARAFPESDDPLTYDNLAEAIAAFERTLRSESRFDDFLNGDTDALTEMELRGLDRFMKVGCQNCHDGALLGGGLFRNIEEKAQYANQEDRGRIEITKDPKDLMVFKVAQLRNVAVTPPYFHDGKIPTLADAVKEMSRLTIGAKLTSQHVDELVAFLEALTGKELEEQRK